MAREPTNQRRKPSHASFDLDINFRRTGTIAPLFSTSTPPRVAFSFKDARKMLHEENSHFDVVIRLLNDV